jgi:hypothetical protein
MKIERMVSIPVIGLLFILGACASQAATMPDAAPPTASAASATTPVPSAATPSMSTPATQTQVAPSPAAPVQATPAPAQAPMTPAPNAGPTAFVVSKLEVSPDQAGPGENVTVVFDVKNTGVQQGTDTLVIDVDGVQVATQDVTLAAGSDQVVNIDIIVPAVGTHTISVGDLAVKLTSYVF